MGTLQDVTSFFTIPRRLLSQTYLISWRNFVFFFWKTQNGSEYASN